MSEKRPLRLPSAKLVAIAALAGLISGIGAVAFRNMGSDPSVQVSDGEQAALCEGSTQRIATLEPLIKGHVAALVAQVNPRTLDLAFKTDDGSSASMQSFAGKAVLLNLWATWCVPCREEMPALNNLQKQLGGDDFEVVAINIDTGDDEKPKTFLTDYKIDELAFYRDNTLGVFNALKKEGLAFGLPATLLLDDKGCLLASMNGPAEWDHDDALALVKAAKAK
jgi:thiol-disulfide isomerase/thioredoxin